MYLYTYIHITYTVTEINTIPTYMYMSSDVSNKIDKIHKNFILIALPYNLALYLILRKWDSLFIKIHGYLSIYERERHLLPQIFHSSVSHDITNDSIQIKLISFDLYLNATKLHMIFFTCHYNSIAILMNYSNIFIIKPHSTKTVSIEFNQLFNKREIC